VWPSLKEDGVLIYATCSYSPEEDEEILDWLGEAYIVETLSVEVPAEWGITRTETNGGLAAYRFFPDKLKGEGLFIAAIRKKEQASAVKYPRYKSIGDVKARQQSSYLLSREDLIVIPASKESFHAIAPAHEANWQMLHKQLYFRKTGVGLGMPSAKEWIPAHDVALSIDRSQSLNAVELSREQALKFLKREDVALPLAEKGWMMMTYGGLGLGWIKSLGNRYNNYLPKHWRIRMDIE
jgi:NOL1/NOP2/fmu family ribosome biogenesis protein